MTSIAFSSIHRSGWLYLPVSRSTVAVAVALALILPLHSSPFVSATSSRGSAAGDFLVSDLLEVDAEFDDGRMLAKDAEGAANDKNNNNNNNTESPSPESKYVPYTPAYTNATMDGVLNATLLQWQFQYLDNEPETIGPFRLRMVWSQEACWQGDCKNELDWCIQCEGFECNEGDILWIELCRNIDQQLFTWTPVTQDKEDLFIAEPDEEIGVPFDDDKKRRKHRKMQANLLAHLDDFNFVRPRETDSPTLAPTAKPTKNSFEEDIHALYQEITAEIYETEPPTTDGEIDTDLDNTDEEWYFPFLTPSPTDTPPPSGAPSTPSPSDGPTETPTAAPSTLAPTKKPTRNPTESPTTMLPSHVPSLSPTKTPTVSPTFVPTDRPSPSPSASTHPTNTPITPGPSTVPSDEPSSAPSETQTSLPTLSQPNEQLGVFKVADPSKNLCLDRVHLNRYQLNQCDHSNSQLFFGFPPATHLHQSFELRPRNKYAIDQLDDKCVNMHHHPRNYEEIINTSCNLARYYHTSLWHVVLDTNHNFHHNKHKNINTFLVGLDKTPQKLTPTPILTPDASGGGKATSTSLYTLLAPRQNPRCSVYTQCGACQGHCSHDDDCVGNLKCFERSWDNPYETPPGCVGEGVARIDYCYAAPGN